MNEPPLFRVCTIVNRPEEYARMRASFAAAGFDAVSTYTAFDNTAGNRFDPFRLLTQMVAESTETYVVFCHQDVLLGADATPARLHARLRELDRADPQWSVAGNAGFDAAGEPVLHLDSAGGQPRCLGLPRRVYSLDENFLVLKARSGLRTSDELGGFHLYGTDVCLQAYRRGGSAYVLDFVVTHLSPGQPRTEDFRRSVQAFEAHWRPRLVVGLIRTTCLQMELSASPSVERWLRRFATLREFLWEVQVPLVFQPQAGGRRSRAQLFAVAALAAAALWRFVFRPAFRRLHAPGAPVRWNRPLLGAEPRHILFVNLPIEFYSPVTGGAIATIIAEMARVLTARGHQVTVLTRTDGTGFHPHGDVVPLASCGPEDLSFWQRQVHKVQWRLKRWDWPYFGHYRRAVVRAAATLPTAPGVVVVFNDLLSPVFLRGLFPGARICVWLQNEQRTRAEDLSLAQRATDRWLTCSESVRNWTLAHHRFDPEKVVVVPSGVNLTQFHPRSPQEVRSADTDEVRVLFVGRLNPDKAPDLVADAVTALRAEGLPVRLTVAGARWFYPQRVDEADPYLEALRGKLTRAGAESLGHVGRERIGEVFRQHDVVCVPSRWPEPFGLVALEAMASGCAVVASNRGGLPEACGDGATLIDPDEPGALQAVLRRWITDRSALNEAKERAWQRGQGASWEVTADRFEAVIHTT